MVNNTALNACVQISVSAAVLSVLGCIPKSEVAGSRGNSMLTVGNCQPLFPKWLHHFISILHAKAYNNYLLARRKKFLHCALDAITSSTLWAGRARLGSTGLGQNRAARQLQGQDRDPAA